MRQRKFIAGDRVDSLCDAVALIEAGSYLMFHHKPMHAAVVANWPLAMLRNYVRFGAIHRADINPLYREPTHERSNTHCNAHVLRGDRTACDIC